MEQMMNCQHYRKINDEYPVYVGEEFWMRLTGDKNFYFDLINAIVEVSEEIEKISLTKKIYLKM